MKGDKKNNVTGLTKFVDLSIRALEEDDPERYMEILAERAAIIDGLIKSGYEMDGEKAAECLRRESLIMERLEKDRADLLKGMETLWRSMQAVKAYGPKFPLPPMPVFFDRKG